MTKRISLLGSIVLGVVFVTAGLSGNFALADVGQNLKADLNDLKSDLKADLKDLKGDVKDLLDTNRPASRVPEPSTVMILGAAGLAGLGIWAWRRKSTKS